MRICQVHLYVYRHVGVQVQTRVQGHVQTEICVKVNSNVSKSWFRCKYTFTHVYTKFKYIRQQVLTFKSTSQGFMLNTCSQCVHFEDAPVQLEPNSVLGVIGSLGRGLKHEHKHGLVYGN